MFKSARPLAHTDNDNMLMFCRFTAKYVKLLGAVCFHATRSTAKRDRKAVSFVRICMKRFINNNNKSNETLLSPEMHQMLFYRTFSFVNNMVQIKNLNIKQLYIWTYMARNRLSLFNKAEVKVSFFSSFPFPC